MWIISYDIGNLDNHVGIKLKSRCFISNIPTYSKEMTQGMSFLTFKERALAIYKDFKKKSLKMLRNL